LTIRKHISVGLILRDTRRLKTAEMKFLRPATGYNSLNHRRNEDVLEECKVDPVERN
jgi:hypothetical protein